VAKIGTMISGKYEITELVGRGGMSHVYRAVDVNLKKEWAVKEIRKQAESPADRIRIQSAIVEADMMKKLDHPAIPRVVDIIDTQDVIYVIMDYIEGETLEAVISSQGVPAVEKVVEWAKVLCEVLSYLHRQEPPIIYRDMKPGNVMLTPDGKVKLIDFGIAREYKKNDVADTVCLGTRGYAAPEQTTGIGQTDQRTDIYNLGVTLHQLLNGGKAGRRRFKIPEGLEYIIEKCMQQNPADRYQNCEELLYDLDNYHNLDRDGRTKEYYERRNIQREVLAGIGSIVLAGIILLAAYFLKGQYQGLSEYDVCMQDAERAFETEEKQKQYLRAIGARPGETAPYVGLIELMEEDGRYTVSEEQILRPWVEKNLQVLQKEENYAELAFRLACLYLDYYDYGKTEQTDNELTRIKSAHRWFKEACRYGKDADEFYAEAQNYCVIGDYVESLLQEPSVAPDWGNYEVYKKEAARNMDVVYFFDESVTKTLGNYLPEGTQIKVTEMNKALISVEKMNVFLEKNGVLHKLVKDLDYTVAENEKNGEWNSYEYNINESNFLEEGIYKIELISVDENGIVYQNVRGLKKIEIVFGVDKTAPNIIAIGVTDAGMWRNDKCEVTIIAEDNMKVEDVEVYVNKSACEVRQEGSGYFFEIAKDEGIETITVIARDAAGNETRRELEEIREALE